MMYRTSITVALHLFTIAGCTSGGASGGGLLGEGSDPREPSERCVADDARGEGGCDYVLGVYWDGDACVHESGCSCVGADCEFGYTTLAGCEEAHAICEREPTEPMEEGCAADDARGEGGCDYVIGVFWNGDACVHESGCSCIGADCDAGYSTLEACETAHQTCPASEPADACEADDARGEGGCDYVIGVFWNGGACVHQSGCTCVGADCDAGYSTLEACETANAACLDRAPTDECAADDARGDGACDFVLGIYWNGTACVHESGCSCSGTDCDAGYASIEDCETTNARCLDASEPPSED